MKFYGLLIIKWMASRLKLDSGYIDVENGRCQLQKGQIIWPKWTAGRSYLTTKLLVSNWDDLKLNG